MPSEKREHSRILIVEGHDDKFAVLGLVQHYFDWPSPWPVWVEAACGVEQILSKGYLSAEIKGRQVETVGVVVDADENALGRYQRIAQLCSALFPALPAAIAASGVIVNNEEDGKRFGVWIMPDNGSPGGLEAFLRPLVPVGSVPLWSHAGMSFEAALKLGCQCSIGDHPKAHLYTWLAWQDPPGQSPGNALKQRVLNAEAQSAWPFVEWFSELFGLQALKGLS